MHRSPQPRGRLGGIDAVLRAVVGEVDKGLVAAHRQEIGVELCERGARHLGVPRVLGVVAGHQLERHIELLAQLQRDEAGHRAAHAVLARGVRGGGDHPHATHRKRDPL